MTPKERQEKFLADEDDKIHKEFAEDMRNSLERDYDARKAAETPAILVHKKRGFWSRAWRAIWGD